MKIGITCGGGTPTDRVVDIVTKAEEDGFSTVWFPNGGGADALPSMAVAGRATESIELGTAIQQTYLCHPILAAQRAAAVADAMGRPGFTLGLGPGHRPHIEGVYREDYDQVAAHTEQYIDIVTGMLAGDAVDVAGSEVSAVGGVALAALRQPVPVVVAALGPKLLRIAGEKSQGTILWMGNAASIRDHVAPHIEAAAGGPSRIIAGLPVCVTDDVDAARSVAGKLFHGYGVLENYKRILRAGGITSPAEAAIVGNEASVAAQIDDLFSAGATDVWAGTFPVGDDRKASLSRTRALLRELAAT